MLRRPAAKMCYSAAGRIVLIEAADDWSIHATSQVFQRWLVTPVEQSSDSPPNLIIRIQCGRTAPPIPSGLVSFDIVHDGVCFTDNEVYYVRFGDSLIKFGPGRSQEVELWVDQPYDVSLPLVAQLLSHALLPGLRRCSIFEIHSAAVVPPNGQQAVMIAGPSGSGKSTLTSLLASSGWGYLSDDILLLRETGQEIEILAWRKFFALNSDTIAAARLNFRSKNPSGMSKERVVPEDHFKSRPIEIGIPGTIIFSTVTGAPRSQLVDLTPAEAMTRLLRLCPWASYDKSTSVEHLRILSRLAQRTSSFVLHGGTDLLDNAASIINRAIGLAVLHSKAYE